MNRLGTVRRGVRTIKTAPLLVIAAVLAVCVAACGASTQQDLDPNDPRDARPDLIFATQASSGSDAAGSITGVLEERDDCLHVVDADGTNDVIAWPPGADWFVGGMGTATRVVVTQRASASTMQVTAGVGDTVRLHGAVAPQSEPVRGCDGPVWIADGGVEVLARVPDGHTPPTPTTDAMGAYALEALSGFHEPLAGESARVLLSRQLTADEVHALIHAFPQMDGTDTGATSVACAAPDAWYCAPESIPWLVIADGGWRLRDALGSRDATLVGVLVDRRPDNAAMILHGFFGTCDAAQFGALLDGVVLPTATAGAAGCRP